MQRTVIKTRGWGETRERNDNLKKHVTSDLKEVSHYRRVSVVSNCSISRTE